MSLMSANPKIFPTKIMNYSMFVGQPKPKSVHLSMDLCKYKRYYLVDCSAPKIVFMLRILHK